jgi:hypothetical protein
MVLYYFILKAAHFATNSIIVVGVKLQDKEGDQSTIPSKLHP